LTLTLGSALSAVLAKGWIDTYLPASAAKFSGDACERHLRAIRAYQWHLDGVLSLIPLLLQLALLLFLAGLVIFVLGDSKSIGAALLVLIALTSVLYIVVTLLPRFSPACPFRTTLSPFVPGTDKMARYKSSVQSSYRLLSPSSSQATSMMSKVISDFRCEPKGETLEVMILAWIVTNSTREDTKDEAVKAIAGLGPDRSKDLHLAMREHNAIPRLCMRLKTISELLSIPSRDDKVLEAQTMMKEAHLRAMLQVIPILEPSASEIKELIRADGILRRWDTWNTNLRPLAFCLWMTILLTHDMSDLEEDWATIKRRLEAMIGLGTFPEVRRKLIGLAFQGLLSKRNKNMGSHMGVLILALLKERGE
jgi:hypothetical protein